ncbi:MAG: cbb3-type cytochrome c oxidase subunit I [Gammaproteobacteria bacterium]|nr:cbb3-type cytochrome c oxidase subunit I [Gammaproteobacteria bacterium]
MNILKWVDQRRHWWKMFAVIFGVSVAVVAYIGVKSYQHAPPISDFVDEDENVVFRSQDVIAGQKVFFRHGLMDYGSFLGDGGLRGPDFTAEALRLTAQYMLAYLDTDLAAQIPQPELRQPLAESLMRQQLKTNRYDARYHARQGRAETGTQHPGAVVLTPAQAHAFERLVAYYREVFGRGGELAGGEKFPHADYIADPDEVRQLTSFFFWGAWLAAAERPGHGYSYTHNWPYDPLAGNLPHGGLVMWSVIGTLALVLSLGVIFYVYGKADREAVWEAQRTELPPLATTDVVERFRPTATQRATFKFFAVAALLFGAQICAGLTVIANFLGLFAMAGIDISDWLPITASRALHTQISILWISVCWFAATIWVLPLICRPEPRGQLASVNLLFAMLLLVGVGTVLGVPLGITGRLGDGDAVRWFGLQGWEFMQLGRAYHIVLYAAFVLWLVVVVRGLWPALRQKQTWSLPNWMVYAIAGIIFMFSASFVATEETSFVIADFWRWVTIHMWVEAFFELFTTIIVAYFLYLMGFVSHLTAARVVYLAAILFLGSGLVGISHNFYWNGKSIETVALGGVLSTLQVVPLILLTLEAWRFRHMPQSSIARLQAAGTTATFGLSNAFLFLVGVSFWNFFGAGVLGFIVNLPIVNYFQHGTYLTINHAHAALFGVFGNLAIASMLFCGRWIIGPEYWNAKLLRTVFWSLNTGLMLMVVMDLFPVGVHQLSVVLRDGYAVARSHAYLHGDVFQLLTWLRGVGVVVFVVGGVIPLVWFMVSRWIRLKPRQEGADRFVVPPTVLAVADAGQRPGT